MLTLQYYVDANERSPFAEWFDDLDAEAVARVTVALARLGEGKFGNTKGVAKVNDQITVSAQAQPASQFYEVKSGDTLSKIAKQVYGDQNKYSAIFEANKPMLKDPDEIYPGQILRIPQQH